MKTFEGVNIYAVNNCFNTEYHSGLKTRLYYAPASFFLTIDLPSGQNSYSNSVTIKNDIEFKGGAWESVDILVDENELKLLLSSNPGKKKIRTELTIYVLGLRTEILGFLEQHSETPFVFAITDANGNNWVLGNLRNRAFIQEAEISSGKKYEDISGAAIKITCNSSVYYYPKSILDIEVGGSFTKGFSIGFKS